MTRARLWTTALCALVAFAACGGSEGGPAENDGNNSAAGGTGGTGAGPAAGTGGGFSSTSSQTGLTACGNFPDAQDKYCQPGQYCIDATFSECASGCLSNANCASDQTCIKAAGENAGTCQNNPTATSCSDVCDRVLACDPVTPRNICMEQCAGFNETCKTCLVDTNCVESDSCWDACGL